MFAVAPGKVDQLTCLQVEMLGADWRQIKENVRRALHGQLARLADRLRQVQAAAATHQRKPRPRTETILVLPCLIHPLRITAAISKEYHGQAEQ